jgi:hypothetical protein
MKGRAPRVLSRKIETFVNEERLEALQIHFATSDYQGIVFIMSSLDIDIDIDILSITPVYTPN